MKTTKHLGLVFGAVAIGVAVLALTLKAQLSINSPTFLGTNTVRITLSGTATNKLYQIEYTPALGSNGIPFSTVATGVVGQTTFDFTTGTNGVNFFRAVETNAVDPLLVATPVMTPGSASYATPTNITITCITPLASIFYTTNGATPTTSDLFLSSGQSVLLSCTTTLKAKAFRSGYTDSGVASNLYQINCAPSVNAGAQQIISSSPTTLQGTVMDDGLTGVNTRFTNWTKISGPGTVTFGNVNQTNSTASFGANGIYVLQLSVSDGQYTNSSQVTIALNPTVKVWLTSPANYSTYTVPTNFTLSATGSISGGFSITQMVFYAGANPIGSAAAAPYTIEWKSVPAGSYALTVVAKTTDTNNTWLASSNVVNITVNWPTNVGQLAFENVDVRIPVAGQPITVTRKYDTRFGASGLFGWNGKTDYEDINIQATSVSSGWEGVGSGPFCIRESASTPHLVTIKISDSEKYYFLPYIVFASNNTNCLNTANPDGCNAGIVVRLAYAPLGQGSLALGNQPANAGMDMVFGAWNGPLNYGTAEDDGFGGCEIVPFEPSLADYTFTAPDGTQYGFDSTGKLASKTDRNGNKISYSSTFITYAHSSVSGSTKRVRLNTISGRIAAIYDPLSLDSSGNITGPPAITNQYDASGNLTNSSRLVSRNPTNYEATGYTYTNSAYPHHITGITDKAGLFTARYEYDGSGRVARQYDGLSNVVSYYFDLANRRYFVTNRLGFSSFQVFNESGGLASSVNTLGAVISYGYDSSGRQISETNALGRVVRYAYDSADNLIGVTNRLGNTNRYFYGAFQNQTVTIDALGRGVTNLYDAKGNLVASTNAAGGVKRLGYDVQGNLVAETNELGQIVRYGYDTFGNVTAITNGVLSVTRFSYDANGNKTNRTDALSRITSYEYDAANRPVRILHHDGSTEGVAYGQPDKTLRQTNQAGIVTAFTYDTIGQKVAVTNAVGTTNAAVTLYGYDTEGNLVMQTDALGRVTRLAYDPAGRLVRRTLPLGVDAPAPPSYQETFSHDAAGNVVSHTDFNGKGTLFALDAEGHVLARTNGGIQMVAFAYDANGARTNMIDASGTTRYLYNEVGLLTNKATPQGTLSYTFDAAGQLLTTLSSTPNGTKTTNVWSAAGQLTNVVDRFGSISRYEYDTSGSLTRLILPNNVTNTFGYDGLSRLTNVVAVRSGTNIANYSYKLDAGGSITNLTEKNGRSVRYLYDARGRFRTETVSSDPGGINGTVNYALDGVGNRLRRESTLTGVTSTTNTFDSNDRISGEGFDPAGNTLTNSSNNALQYDGDNQLTNFNAAQVVVIYDGDGNRVKKTVGGVTTLYLIDDLNETGYAQVLEELSATNATPVRLYTYGVSLISQRSAAGTNSYYGFDGQRNIRYLTDTSGSISDTYTYDAFGNGLASTGTTTNSYRFAGEQLDNDLGLYFLRARYLNHKSGRFITRDTFPERLTQPHTLHPYLYAAVDPVNNSDPSGLEDANTQITTTGIQGQLNGQTQTAIARAYKYSKEVACKLESGVYIFESKFGKKYVGRTLRALIKRLKEHSRPGGKINLDDLGTILWIEGPSNASALQLEQIEQLVLDFFEQKGVPTENIRDPLGGRPDKRFRLCK